MYRLDLRNFKGVAPKRHSRLLDATYADAVTDAKLWDGTLRNFPCPTVHCETGATVQTITPLPGCECLTWPERVHLARDCGLVFWTGDGMPQMATESGLCAGESCRWCIPCPDKAPDLAYTPCTTDKAIYVSYAHTRLVQVGGRVFESALSPPTGMIPVCEGEPVTVSGLNNPHGCAAGYRIYRAESGIKTGALDTPANNAWMLVGESSASQFVDEFRDCEPATPLLHEHGCPPDDLHHLHITESGVMVGLSGAELWYTLPGDPMTWSRNRRRMIRAEWGKPLALSVHKDDVYVLTDHMPVHYRLALSDAGPQLQRNLIPKHLPIASLTSLSSGYQGVVYASDSGLVMLNGGQAQVISSPWFNRDQWRRLDPASIVGAVHDEAYVMASSVDAFLFEFGDGVFADNGNTNLIGLDLGGRIVGADAMYSDDALYWAKGGVVYRWDWEAMPVGNHKDPEVQPEDQGECCPFFYRPAIEDKNGSATYTAAEVHMRPGSEVTFRYYDVDCREPVLVDEEVRTDCEPFRLTDCRRTEDSRIELSGCGIVDSVTLGTSLQALRLR
ncbi:MAG: hypothetical protein KDI44_09210 [Thiothrix sp.]|nr:hypothetical protein [Thiothrix sp.]